MRVSKVLYLLFSLNLTATADPCQQIVLKVVKPPPAVLILNERGDHRLLDAKERYELSKQYRQDIQRITELLGKYIELRRQIELIQPYLAWQWQRVQAGIEYKKDIWEKEIKELAPAQAQLKNIQRQLSLLGVSPKDLELCYQASK